MARDRAALRRYTLSPSRSSRHSVAPPDSRRRHIPLLPPSPKPHLAFLPPPASHPAPGMGASASRRRSSPSLPVSSTLTEIRSTATVITVDDYSRHGLVPVGSPLIYEAVLLDVTYRIEIYPSGFNQHTTDCIAVFAGRTGDSSTYFPRHRRPAARFFFEILYGSAAHQRTVFDNFTALSSETTWVSQAKGLFRAFESKEPGRVEKSIRSGFNRKEASHMTGFIRFVNRKELEASGCIKNDSFTIRTIVKNLLGERYISTCTCKEFSVRQYSDLNLFFTNRD